LGTSLEKSPEIPGQHAEGATSEAIPKDHIDSRRNTARVIETLEKTASHRRSASLPVSSQAQLVSAFGTLIFVAMTVTQTLFLTFVMGQALV